MEEFRATVAENLIRLRTDCGMTQAELGARLSYSDKSISKWERGDAVPDAYVLKKIAALYGVTVDYLLEAHGAEEPSGAAEQAQKPAAPQYSHKVIMMISVTGVMTLAVIVFVLVWLLHSVEPMIFVYACVVSFVVLLVLNSIWGKGIANFYIISALVWGILAAVYLSVLSFFGQNWWQLFLVGIPAELLVILCFNIRKRPK